MAATKINLPVRYVRQSDEHIDGDWEMTTTQRTAYLTSARRYSGQIVYDTTLDKLFRLNFARTTWLPVGETTYIQQGTNITITGNGTEGNPYIINGNASYSDEQAQDAVGGILTDTNSIDLTYNDTSNQITADVKRQNTTSINLTVDSGGLKADANFGSTSGTIAEGNHFHLPNVATGNISGSVTIDLSLSVYLRKNIYQFTLSGNVSSFGFTNLPAEGTAFVLYFIQSGTGQYGVSFNTSSINFLGNIPTVVKGLNPLGVTRLACIVRNNKVEISYNNQELNKVMQTSDNPALPTDDVTVLTLIGDGTCTFTLPASPRVGTLIIWNRRTGAATSTNSIIQSGNTTPSTKTIPINEYRAFDWSTTEWMMR